MGTLLLAVRRDSNQSLPPPVADEGKRGGVIASNASGANPTRWGCAVG